MGKAEPKPEDYIVPLNMNGLNGRMMHMPAPKGRKREILVLYGHHSSLERWFGLAQVINRYGAVTMPDWPGFGGMDSFYKIGDTDRRVVCGDCFHRNNASEHPAVGIPHQE